MSTYKITNITNTVGKRELKYNSVLDVDYIDNMVKRVIKIKPGNSVYLTTLSLPLSIHRLRVKGLVIVEEISATELAKLTKPAPQVNKEVKESKPFSKFGESVKDLLKKEHKKTPKKREEEE